MSGNGVPDGPAAVVLSCDGGSQGDLGVVRTLGRRGVRVLLVSEGRKGASTFSRYVAGHHVVGDFGDTRRVLSTLAEIARAEKGGKPVLIPTADPDLLLVSEQRDVLGRSFELVTPSRDIVSQCLDKARFFHFALAAGFSIPQTWCPRDASEVEAIGRAARFPLILKPMLPPTWSREPVATLVGHKKALTVHSPAELEARYRTIAELEPGLVVQDYVPGRDDRLYSLHVYMSQASEPLGWFTGRKLRTYPTYAGIGCFVESVSVPEIVADGIDMLRRIRYSGLALLQFKRDDRDGTYKLLEINPRTSSWNLLAAEAGVNLPYIAWRDAVGAPPQAPPVQRDGLRYLYFDHDVRAFWDYRKHGDITLTQWLGSLRGPKVYQLFAADDPSPFLHDLGGKARRLLSRLTPGRSGRGPAGARPETVGDRA